MKYEEVFFTMLRKWSEMLRCAQNDHCVMRCFLDHSHFDEVNLKLICHEVTRGKIPMLNRATRTFGVNIVREW